MPEKVKYGLKNFHWWPVTETVSSQTGKTTTTYGTGHAMKGIVKLSQDAQGSKTVFRADDTDYFDVQAHGGYSGAVSFANITELADYCFDIQRDKNGVAVETDQSGLTTKYFACAFEFASDAKAIRHVLYKCSITRPGLGSETTPEGNTPNVQPDEVTMTSVARPDDGLVHNRADALTDADVYDAFYTTPYIPEYEDPEPDPDPDPDPDPEET